MQIGPIQQDRRSNLHMKRRSRDVQSHLPILSLALASAKAFLVDQNLCKEENRQDSSFVATVSTLAFQLLFWPKNLNDSRRVGVLIASYIKEFNVNLSRTRYL